MPDPIGGVQPFAELARGGPTVVYKGYQRAHDRFVLLKAVRPELGGDAGLGARLAEEARLAVQVRHPNVVAVLETGHDGRTAYLITEFVEGLDLRALVARGPLPPELAAYVVLEAARGLAAVHASGILHRDLKPANVLVSEAGEVKLADFGLASLAPDGAPAEAGAEVRGTLPYLAPEVVRGEAPSPAADLFALGAVLAELLTGHAVFDREGPGATLDAVLHHDPVPALAADPRVPPALAALAAKLLAKDPAQRLASASLLVEEVEAVRRQHGRAGAEALAAFVQDPATYSAPTPEPDEEGPGAIAERVPLPTRPARRSVWAVVLVALAVLLALGYATTRPEPAPPEDLAAVSRAGPAHALGPEPEVPAEPPPDATEPEAVAPAADASVGDGEEPEPAPSEEAEADAAEPVESPPEPPVAAAPLTGSLVLAAEPWAEVRVDGQPVGTTPLGALTVPAGRRTVTFENPDFPPHTVQVEVDGGETERVAVSLWDLVGRVTLVVSPWARVSVDGTHWDTVPPQRRPLILTPGTHRLVFEHPALDPYETTLRIAAGEVRTVRVNLADGRP